MKISIGKQEQNRYLQNKEAKTGETIKCPICGDVFIQAGWHPYPNVALGSTY